MRRVVIIEAEKWSLGYIDLIDLLNVCESYEEALRAMEYSRAYDAELETKCIF